MADNEVSSEPQDRLTRLCAVARDAVLASPEWDDDADRMFISLDSLAERRSGFYAHNYKTPRELVVTLLMHIRALSRSGADLN